MTLAPFSAASIYKSSIAYKKRGNASAASSIEATGREGHRAPAPPNIAVQIYTQATMTKMIAHCTQSGESMDRAIPWAADELEGFMRG